MSGLYLQIPYNSKKVPVIIQKTQIEDNAGFVPERGFLHSLLPYAFAPALRESAHHIGDGARRARVKTANECISSSDSLSRDRAGQTNRSISNVT